VSFFGGKKVRFIFAFAAIFLFRSSLQGAALLDDWRPRNPLPTASNLRAVAYGNDRFVAVGDRGSILVSSDGLAWIENIDLNHLFSRIAFGSGLFAASESDGISTSVDGINWIRRTAPPVNEIKYLNGVFVGVGLAKTVSSPDGITWTTTQIDAPLFSSLTGVTYGKGIFVAIGSEPLSDPESPIPPPALIFTSTNGSVWTRHTAETLSSPNKIAFGNDVFVSVGGSGRIWYSSDALTWTEAAAGSLRKYFWDLMFAEGQFIAVGDPSAIYNSTDGKVWTLRNTNVFSSLQGITRAQGKFVVVGSGGGVMESHDGSNWTTRSKGPQPRLFSCTYGGGRFVAVGGVDIGAYIFTSEDGFSWQDHSFPEVTYLRSIAYGNGTFVAAGARGSVFTSLDGSQWSFQDSHRTNWDFSGMTYANGQFVAVANDSFRNGGILTSSNGIDWSIRYTGADDFLFGITHGNGLYVAVGGNLLNVAEPSIILTSVDGHDWTPRDAGVPSTLWGVAYGNGIFVAVRYGALAPEPILTSADGIIWNKQTQSAFAAARGITFGEGQFVAFAANGSIFTTTNGITWKPRNSHTHHDLWGGAYGNGTFVAVGDSGTIIQTSGFAPRFHPEQTRLSEDGVMRMIIETPSGIDFTLEGNSDLESWLPLGTVTNSPGIIELADPASRASEKRFYKINRTSQ
jgi:photosystem II stability/assembly factor-like uncharacterized protein